MAAAEDKAMVLFGMPATDGGGDVKTIWWHLWQILVQLGKVEIIPRRKRLVRKEAARITITGDLCREIFVLIDDMMSARREDCYRAVQFDLWTFINEQYPFTKVGRWIIDITSATSLDLVNEIEVME